jgi:hypothetical protein
VTGAQANRVRERLLGLEFSRERGSVTRFGAWDEVDHPIAASIVGQPYQAVASFAIRAGRV